MKNRHCQVHSANIECHSSIMSPMSDTRVLVLGACVLTHYYTYAAHGCVIY
jgi:hypothetical protein